MRGVGRLSGNGGSMQTLTNAQVDGIEQTHGFVFPGLYRKLLVEVGYGHIGSSAEIYDPRRTRNAHELFFHDPSQLFARYFPFGIDHGSQEIWVIDAWAERAASIWHETVPDDWPDENWLPYEVWVTRYLEPLVGGS
jgi:hypothetical protein